MKLFITSIALLSSLALANSGFVVETKPDFTKYLEGGIYSPGAMSCIGISEISERTIKNVYRTDGLRDSVYVTVKNAEQNPYSYVSKFVYNFADRYYSQIMSFPDFSTGKLAEMFTVKRYFNADGMPLVDTTFRVGTTTPSSAGAYELDKQGRVKIWRPTIVEVEPRNVDSIVWYYTKGTIVDSMVTLYSKGSSISKSVNRPHYSNSKVDSVVVNDFYIDSNQPLKTVFRNYFAPTSLESKVYKGNESIISVQNGQLRNVPLDSHIEATVLQLNGRKILTLELSKDLTILNWNRIPKGIYLLSLRGNSLNTTVQFSK